MKIEKVVIREANWMVYPQMAQIDFEIDAITEDGKTLDVYLGYGDPLVEKDIADEDRYSVKDYIRVKGTKEKVSEHLYDDIKKQIYAISKGELTYQRNIQEEEYRKVISE